MNNELHKIMQNIINIQKRKNDIQNITKSIMTQQLQYEFYNLNNDDDFNQIKTKYEKDIQNMMNGCFGKAERSIKKDNGFWILTKIEDKLVAGLLVDYARIIVTSLDKSVTKNVTGLWIWNVCRDTSPQYKEYGIGKATIKKALQYIKQKMPNFDIIYLLASQTPISRTKFYESIGFQKTNYYDTHYNDPLMIYFL